MKNTNRKAALIILDGWGHGNDASKSAIDMAETPFIDSLYKKGPNSELITYGEDVGLPEGQMGNSEVGHLNIGAGRVVYQELARINKAIKSGDFGRNEVLIESLKEAEKSKNPVHIMGLLSDGGVHSHINHLLALCDVVKNYNISKINLHLFLDGRDTDPHGGIHYLEKVINHIENSNCKLQSVIGRYYAMDRDQRWERTEKAYSLITKGSADIYSDDIIADIMKQYDEGITDEFMIPISAGEKGKANTINNGDTVLFFNFRTDRPRQITRALTQENFPEYTMEKLDLNYITMTMYDETYTGLKVMFTRENINNTLGEIISDSGLSQLRAAETEKYPHVTFFFNGGEEKSFPREKRILTPSPKVATYDLQPEMSAIELTDKVITYIKKKVPEFICINYANTDMVGHTGIMEAAMKAASTVDKQVKILVNALEKEGYFYIIIADHGNADIMINADGSPHTAHTTNLVPMFIGGRGLTSDNINLEDGRLADIAPTILYLLDLNPPSEMDGNCLITHK